MGQLKNKFIHGLLAATVAASLGACGGSKTPGTAANANGGKINTLSSISVNDTPEKTVVEIQGQSDLSPNVFKLTDPLRVIVDFTDTQVGDVKSPVSVNNGIINEITASQFDDVSSSLSRVVIGFDASADYTVTPNKQSLLIEISKAGVAVNSQQNLETLSTEGTSMATLPPVTGGSPEEMLAAVPVEGSTALEPAMATGASATALKGVAFQAEGENTNISLQADGPISNYEEFVLESPKRLVVDLKGLAMGYKGKPKLSVNQGIVSSVRTGGHTDKIRVVVDFKGDAAPNYQIQQSPSGLNIVVSPNALAASDVSPLAAAPVASATAANALGDISELPLDQVPVDEAFLPAPTAETGDNSLGAADVSLTEPSDSGKPITVTKVSFSQKAGKARLTITTTGTAKFEKNESEANKVTLKLLNSKFKKGADRTLDTQAFDGPVAKISPKHVGTDSDFVIDLKQAVPANVFQDGNLIHLDFEGTAVATPAEAAPALPNAAEKTETNTEAALAPEIPKEAPAELAKAPELPTDATAQPFFETAAPVDTQKKYEYVKEELLSDAVSKTNPSSNNFGSDLIIVDEGSAGNRYNGRKINLDFKDADIRALFRLFADISKLNVIVGDDVTGKVTIKLEDVPWDQAFAILLQTQNLGAIKYGNILRIAPADKIQKERELHAQAKKAAVAAAPMDTLFKAVSYSTAAEIANRVRSILSERGSVDTDDRTNTVIIRDIREKLTEAKKLIEKLDAQTPQVTIEARIVEATTRFVRNWGVVWGGSTQFTAATGNPTGLLFPNRVGAQGALSSSPIIGGTQPILLSYPATGSNASTSLTFGSINNVLNLDLLLGYEESEGNAKLISSPKVTVLDNKSATIMSGTKIPYISQTANSGTNVRFESAVIAINVTPHITADGSVIMTVSASRNEPDFGNVVQGNPSIVQREANTQVLVKSGNTTVIGGIYRINRSVEASGFPFLRKIPIIGYLFSSDNRRLDRQELLIFITPRIVGDDRTVVRQISG